MDPTLNEFVPIPEDRPDLSDDLARKHRENLVRLLNAGEITTGEFESRDAMDNPTFWKGETIILKGYKFRVDHIGRRKLILKPVRG